MDDTDLKAIENLRYGTLNVSSDDLSLRINQMLDLIDKNRDQILQYSFFDITEDQIYPFDDVEINEILSYGLFK